MTDLHLKLKSEIESYNKNKSNVTSTALKCEGVCFPSTQTQCGLNCFTSTVINMPRHLHTEIHQVILFGYYYWLTNASWLTNVIQLLLVN